MRTALALDLGSSSVRAVVGTFSGEHICMREVFRMPHTMIDAGTHLEWDIHAISAALGKSIEASRHAIGDYPDTVGIDSWGVDYGYLDDEGKLLRAPRAYRDGRMARYAQRFEEQLPETVRWQESGIQPQLINTINQMSADIYEEAALADRAAQALLIPDLMAYFLGAPAASGRSIASTTGLAEPGCARWNQELLRLSGIPVRWLPPVEADIASVGITQEGIEIVRPGGHDTACAVHSLGLAHDEERLFISCGSWSLVGVTLGQPVLSPAVHDAGLSNEVRSDGGTRLLRNLSGLWLLQACQRAWGESNVAALVEAARQAPSLNIAVDPDDPVFADAKGEPMPDRLSRWCEKHYGLVPCDRAQTVRLILDSLACAHARWIDALGELTGVGNADNEPVYMCGGGVHNDYLLQATADACGREIVVCSPEASVLGNLMAQFEVSGCIGEADRYHVAQRSACARLIMPHDDPSWQTMRARLADATENPAWLSA